MILEQMERAVCETSDGAEDWVPTFNQSFLQR